MNILAYAEDAAVEDSLYFLGESLRRDVLDCESFLKHVRNLSRYLKCQFFQDWNFKFLQKTVSSSCYDAEV